MSNKYIIVKYINKVIKFKFYPSSLYHPHDDCGTRMMVGYVHRHFKFNNLIVISSSPDINIPANTLIYGTEVGHNSIELVLESDALLFKLISNF